MAVKTARRGVTVTTDDELRLEIENVDLRRLLAQAGIDAAEHKIADQLQRILLADGRFAPESGQIAESSIGPLRARSSQTVDATFNESLSAAADQKQAASRVLSVATVPPARREVAALV